MSDTVVFTFGRMNPPTKGHELIINTVVKTAQELDADHVVFLSQSHGTTRDPLGWDFKRRVCQNIYPGVWISNDRSITNPFIALDKLKDEYTNIIMITGSDQVADYEKFTAYANTWGVHYRVISAGARNVKSRGLAGMSATKMRHYAELEAKRFFMEGLPKTINSNVRELVYKRTVNSLRKANKK